MDLPIPPMPLIVTVTSLVNVTLVFKIAVLICLNNSGREVKLAGSVGGRISVQIKMVIIIRYLANTLIICDIKLY